MTFSDISMFRPSVQWSSFNCLGLFKKLMMTMMMMTEQVSCVGAVQETVAVSSRQ